MSTDRTAETRPGSLLGDSPARDYGGRLERWARFAAPELRAVVAGLGLSPDDRVVDAGCGPGLIAAWLAERVGPGGRVLALDLSAAHARAAGERAAASGLPLAVAQADVARPPARPGAFDLVWCSSTINHLRDPLGATVALRGLLRPGGRLVLAQGGFLPPMFFAWDWRLETRVNEALRRFYREKYGVSERELAPSRALVGLARAAGLADVSARTHAVERTAPLGEDDERYFVENVFRAEWGERLDPWLEPDDRDELRALCDPASPRFCLRRPDFHHVQTFTVVTGRA